MTDSTEPVLKRLTVAEERALNLLPKPSTPLDRLNPESTSDPLVQALIKYQERLQLLSTSLTRKTNTLLDYNRRLNQQLRQATDRWNENFLPIGVLSLLAIGGTWRSRPAAPLPLKIGASAAATALTWMICLPQERTELAQKIIPGQVRDASEQVFSGIGESGARVWHYIEEGYSKIKERML